MSRVSFVVSALAVAGAASLAYALNPQPLPPGIYFSFDLNGTLFELRQGAAGGSTPTVHTDFSYRLFEPPNPCRENAACAPTRGSFEVSAPNVNLARAAGLAAAVAGSACVDQATLAAALSDAGATLLTYEPPDPCLRASGGNPSQVVLAMDAAARALGTGGDLLGLFNEIVGSMLPVPRCGPPPAP